ncbi:MAG: hypothetical protein JAY99_05640 [Candidatus Thiodiazotropha lotti]|uniref:Uncharacterized protein n=1 Tax=Candidatus Thiodiazotropha endoloripes TaxID=1818881 RepID=A0A1E2UKQ5_9GAMM|nr:hypothetical protein [Candidatus Thiodiazotropha endoloripes]MCG7899523.1 hypothetical protein [Candidatus Thiodiazotropha weberae]MCG7992922.1 hypothetical protein [Candidatus Thiodiazotropha lotti]MCG7903228.1 hypothetical protein [Candidatus Thiodiazotropha weberae]MCG7915607.1 hypothetical protein [Candidatus Thiodiazotropha weberae]MCG7998987.1 hypothetical protein [Candidatus Thiodiazotropha lotti]
MLKNLILASMATFTLLVAGCNGGGDDVEVEEFRINGSSSELEDGRVTIDSAINNGEFELVWEVDDDNASGYNAYFWLSVNSNLDEDNDIRFYYVWCGEYGRCDHDDRNEEDCWFDNNLEMVCEDDDNYEYDVDELIDSLPEDLYVIIEACNGADCDTEVVPVRLR